MTVQSAAFAAMTTTEWITLLWLSTPARRDEGSAVIT